MENKIKNGTNYKPCFKLDSQKFYDKKVKYIADGTNNQLQASGTNFPLQKRSP